MNTLRTQLIALALFAISLGSAHAARPTQDKAEASHIVVGTVRNVFKSVGEKYTSYAVLLNIKEVQKGDGLEVGKLFYTYCYQRNPIKGNGPIEPGSIGHSAVPKKGQRIKVFVNRGIGLWEGVYPHWFEAAPEK